MRKDLRFIVLVLDSVGCGELPDAERFGDRGSDTLGNIAKAVGGLDLPHLASLGLGNVHPIQGVAPVAEPRGAFGKMGELSDAKDTTSGHWELMGLHVEEPFPTYPKGFPTEVLGPWEKAIGRKSLGNKASSGTEIIKELGERHVKTGRPIVYTSADSVFQVAAHEHVIPVPELYRICRIARGMLSGKHAVGRVIARPFTGKTGNFTRTKNRKDFSLKPHGPTLLDMIIEAGGQTCGVGKIGDIFSYQGLTDYIYTSSNKDGIFQTISAIMTDSDFSLIFTNLVDFDMKYGHRNDPQGYADALEEFDNLLPQIMKGMRPEDIMIITADHGCDPTTASTDHSREYVPLLVWGKRVKGGVDLGVRETFADVAKTIADYLEIEGIPVGTTFRKEIEMK